MSPTATPRIGRYVIQRELGSGASGVVFRAWDPTLGRAVAVKLLLERGPRDLERFQREAAAAGRLAHPGIVSLHEVGVHEGRPFIVMALVEGESLDARLRREPMPVLAVAELGQELATALAHAHERGIIHRDVKPSNVIIDETGRALLADFGLAKVTTIEALTATGDILGTPAYMAPEQARGEPRLHGPPTDVHALGALIFRGLTGSPPFSGGTCAEVLRRILVEEAEPPSQRNAAVPAALDAIVLRCLAKRPEDRYPTAAALAKDLERFLETARASRGAPAVPSPRATPGARHPGRLALAAALGALAVAPLAAWAPGAWTRREARLLAAEGHARRLAGDIEGAIAILSTAVELDPRLAPAWSERAFAFSRHGADPRAFADASRAVELAPGDLDAHLARAEAAVALGDFARAGADLDLVLAGRAEDADALVLRAVLMRRVHPGNEARAACDRAVALAPRSARAWAERGLTLAHRSDRRGALVDLTKALEIDPGCTEALANRAALLLIEGKVDEAIADATRVIDLAPWDAVGWAVRACGRARRGALPEAESDAARALELSPYKADAWAARARVRLEKEDLAGADADALRASELLPSYFVPVAVQAEVFRRLGDLPDAIDRASLAIDRYSDAAMALETLGAALVEAGSEPARAHAALERALAIDPGRPVARAFHALVRGLEGDRRAREELDGLVAANPRTADVLAARAFLAASEDDYGRAAEIWTRAIELAPRRLRFIMTRGNVSMRGGDFEAARADFSRAIERAPSLAEGWEGRADARCKLGDFAGAIADYDRAIDLAPTHFLNWLGRGRLHRELGEIDAAVRDLRRFIELAPGEGEVPDVKKWLERPTAGTRSGGPVGPPPGK